jgi:hypothetical protein
MRKTKQQQATDKAIEAAFNKFSIGHRISVMNLSKITDAGQKAADLGQSIDEAVKAACEQYNEK